MTRQKKNIRGETGAGVLYLVFFWTFIPSILALVAFISLLPMSDEAQYTSPAIAGLYYRLVMTRITTLKTSLSTVSTDRLAICSPASWRDGRISSTQRGYTYKWQQYRAGFLRENPLCAYCKRHGTVKAASVVDHIEPHRGNMTLFWRSQNHQALCKPCHDSIKQREEQRNGR